MGAVIVGAGLLRFFFEMVHGGGWICIALLVFGAWRPERAMQGTRLFARLDALQIRMQQTPMGQVIPYQVFLMAPYILSILALILMSRPAQLPAALLLASNRGER